MNQEEMLARELQRLERIDRDAELALDDESLGEDTEVELELFAARVKSARLTGVPLLCQSSAMTMPKSQLRERGTAA